MTLAAGILILLVLAYAQYWRPEAVVQRPQLPVAFEHIDHKGVACTECHHNFVDDTGSGSCYYCHKVTPEIAADIEPMFHDFCWGCHVDMQTRGEESGPLRECSLCHH